METARLESMSHRGFLKLYRQDDGDIVVTVGQGDGNDGWRSFSTVEFCTPGAGGGGSKRTHAALVDLMAAMAADNLDGMQDHRRPPRTDPHEDQRIVDWHKGVTQARKEMAMFTSGVTERG